MAVRELSLHVVGADYPNSDGGNRRFEILLCKPGEPVTLVAEPRNPADPNAIRVLSARAVQIGYLTADRAAWIAGMLRDGCEVRAVFQQATRTGAAIRAAIGGGTPTLPATGGTAHDPRDADERYPDPDPGFWPDEQPSDD